MFVKVVHSDNCHTVFECSSFQYTRLDLEQGGAAITDTDERDPCVEILLCDKNGDVMNSLSFSAYAGDKDIYVMGNDGKTIETYHVSWPTAQDDDSDYLTGVLSNLD